MTEKTITKVSAPIVPLTKSEGGTRRLSRFLLTILLWTSPLAAQYYKGVTNFHGTTGNVVTQIVLSLKFNGDEITGEIGIGSVVGGATIVGTLTANIPVQGTRSGQNCTVAVTGPQPGAVYTGICTATSFYGTYHVGSQTGTFNVTASGPAPLPIAPVPPPVTPVKPPARVVPVIPTPELSATLFCGNYTNTSLRVSGIMQIRSIRALSSPDQYPSDRRSPTLR
jgi:hypothetical protein